MCGSPAGLETFSQLVGRDENGTVSEWVARAGAAQHDSRSTTSPCLVSWGQAVLRGSASCLLSWVKHGSSFWPARTLLILLALGMRMTLISSC